MKCLTPEKTLTGDCEFLAANLYAKSMFGESALANLSIEVGSNGFVQGMFMVFALEITWKISFRFGKYHKILFRSHSNPCKESGYGNQSGR